MSALTDRWWHLCASVFELAYALNKIVQIYQLAMFTIFGLLHYIFFVCFSARFWNRRLARLVFTPRLTGIQLARRLSIFARHHCLVSGLVRDSNRRAISPQMFAFISVNLVNNLF